MEIWKYVKQKIKQIKHLLNFFIGLNHLRKLKIADYNDNSKKIVEILSAYDNLIENNNKRIRLLEQMAENLYKEWFVRFRFPGHEKAEFENGLPMGWREVVADTKYDINGKDLTAKASTDANGVKIKALSCAR